MGGNLSYHRYSLIAPIIISFGCYLPATILSEKYTKVGFSMIPKPVPIYRRYVKTDADKNLSQIG